jgi:hypothetical protein
MFQRGVSLRGKSSFPKFSPYPRVPKHVDNPARFQAGAMAGLRCRFHRIVLAACTFVWCTVAHAESRQDISALMLEITEHTGIGVDEIVGYLTLGRASEHAEPTLVRWDQSRVTLGLVISEDAPAALVEAVVVGIQRRFGRVDRTLAVCVREWPGGSTITDEAAAPIAKCESSEPTEIDLVIDISDHDLLQGIEALPSDTRHHFLRGIWSRIRRDIVAQPDLHFCNFGYTTDAAAQRLIGAAGIVWIPTTGKKALQLAEDCSVNMGYYLLGSIPILDRPGGDSGTLSPDLLSLLYSDKFDSGQSRSDVLKILREAQR